MVGDHLLDRLAQPVAHAADVLEELGRRDDVEHRAARRHRQRVAAIGRAVGADDHALRGMFGREARADREAAADALGDRHDVGGHAEMLVGEQLPGPRDAALDLVEDQQRAVLVGEVAQALEELDRRDVTPPSPWIGSTMKPPTWPACGPAMNVLHRGEVVERQDGEPVGQRLEPAAHLVRIGRADPGHRPAVEGVAEGDDAELLRVAEGELAAPRRLDRALERLGARIGEEHRVGEGQVDEPLGDRRLAGHLVQVRHVHQRRRLVLDRLRQVRMAVAERIDRDAGGEVEPAVAVGVEQIRALAAHRRDFAAAVDGHHGVDRHARRPNAKRRPQRPPIGASV